MLTQKIVRWGNSLAVRLPKNFADSLRLAEGASVRLALSRGRLIVEPAPQQEFTLDDLVQRITDQNLHAETDTGKPVGRETW